MKPIHEKLFFLLLLVLLLLVYSKSLFFGFTYLDDYVQVVNNPYIKSLDFSSLISIFSNTFVGMYQPATTTIYALIYSFFGMNATGFHFLSLFIHFCNAVLVYTILSNFFVKKELLCLLTLVFALHPMQVESVAWVSAFSTLTYSLFFLLGYLYYLKFRCNNKQGNYFISLLFFILACFSKSAAVTLPVILVLTDLYYKFSIKEIKWLNKIPYFVISIVFGIITLKSRETAGHLSDLSISFDAFDRIFLVAHSILFYPFTFLFPNGLSAFYPYPQLAGGALPLLYYFSIPVLIILAFLLFKYRTRQKIILGSGWFLITIALVLQIIPVGNQITTDRYIYLPMLGLLVVLGFLLNKVNKKIILALALIPLFFGFLSYQRSFIWENDEALWLSVLEEYPNVSQAYNNLGSYALENKQAKKAFDYFNRAIKIQPNYADAYSNRGNLYAQSNKPDLAIKDFTKAIALKDHADAYFNRANEYSKLGKLNEAIADYSASIQLKETADTYTNRAFAYLKAGKVNLAKQDLTKALNIDKQFDQAFFLKGIVAKNQGDLSAACSFFQKAAQLGNQNAKAAFQQTCP